MKKIQKVVNVVFFYVCSLCNAQSIEVNLWNGTIPNAINNSEFKEIKVFKDSILNKTSQVSVPTITIFKPEQPNGTSVVIFPGGGYKHLAINKEGYKVAKFLNNLGITAFVLKYRLPNNIIMKDKKIGPLQDAQEAIRFVRRKAEIWNLNKNKIGVIGFSAGGHLAATLSTQFNKTVYKMKDDVTSKINFSILIYPVISMEDSITHKGSKINLLGKFASKENTETFSNEKRVSTLTPKTFLVHASDDKSVPIENSLQYYLALKVNNIPVEIHIYEKGGHGFGLGKSGTSKSWTSSLINWLIENDLTN
ncbi:alpha/beta hydrolase [Polaribacter haliotis]|uniref:Alpha/beta hydrolase n=1 Tax=Polaribacter haliotis TaxID=1888915 RepID=A0A7L8ADX5_9FLAO|nr:alpha/beta hydrolase [Polaribacter haliotis]QOD60206.1 alpha/beta hydrolase [Polaribacter haliotis]